MELTIRHFIPGRVRLHIPSLCRRRSLAEASLTWLRARDGIRSARINYDCACLIVEYDVAYEALLRAVIGRLRLMSIVELRSLVMPTELADDGPTERAAGRGFANRRARNQERGSQARRSQAHAGDRRLPAGGDDLYFRRDQRRQSGLGLAALCTCLRGSGHGRRLRRLVRGRGSVPASVRHPHPAYRNRAEQQ